MSPSLIPLELETCRRDVLYWFDWWAWTYNPNLINPDGTSADAHLPFDLFKRQREMVQWTLARIHAREDGVLEKSREIGFTYVMGGLGLHQWLFVPGFKSAFASRTKDLVDTVGNPDSIFEKIRIMRDALPHWMLPVGWAASQHDNYCRMINPANGNTIIGEGGDEIGRGGRNSWLLYDEAAFAANGDRADRSTSANSQCRIFGSTVNGMGDMFARKRHGGTLRPHQIFRFHFTDDPRKDATWEKNERGRLEEHVFASEYDIDYSAAVEGIAIPAKWVQSAKKLKHLLAAKRASLERQAAAEPDATRAAALRAEVARWVLEPDPRGVGGLDVGAGKAKSVFVPRFGPVVRPPTAWGDPDTTETALRGLDAAQEAKAARSNGTICTIRTLRFDEPGVGKGVLSTLSRHGRPGITASPVNTGNPPTDTTWPDGKTSEEKFGNLKAEIWFLARERFKLTHQMVLWLEANLAGLVPLAGIDPPVGAVLHPLSDLISLPDDSEGGAALKLSSELSMLKWFRNEKGKTVMETKIQLRTRGVASPDHADALMLTFVPDTTIDDWLGAFGDRR